MKVIVIFLASLFAQVTWSCTCVETTDEQAWDAASAVMLVRVTTTRYVPSDSKTEFDVVLASFKVIEIYKGEQGKLLHLKAEKSACEMPLIAGDYYLIYSRGMESESLNSCTRSRWVNLIREKALLDEYSKRK